MVPTLAGAMPYMGLNFAAFELMRAKLPKDESGRVGTHLSLACGALSGLASQSLTYPIDTVRRRMQLQGARDGPPLYRHSLHCLFKVIRDEGPAALYRGITANLVRTAPNVAIQFTAYDTFKRLFGVQTAVR